MMRKQENEKLMEVSDSSSEEEICQDMNRTTLREAVPAVMDTNRAGCGIAKISGHLHIQQIPCDDHHDDFTEEYGDEEYGEEEYGDEEYRDDQFGKE